MNTQLQGCHTCALRSQFVSRPLGSSRSWLEAGSRLARALTCCYPVSTRKKSRNVNSQKATEALFARADQFDALIQLNLGGAVAGEVSRGHYEKGELMRHGVRYLSPTVQASRYLQRSYSSGILPILQGKIEQVNYTRQAR